MTLVFSCDGEVEEAEYEFIPIEPEVISGKFKSGTNVIKREEIENGILRNIERGFDSAETNGADSD